MTNAVKEIIKDIETNKDTWKICGYGIQNDEETIKITGYGNTALLSCISLEINDEDINITYLDRFWFERTIKHWYDIVSLETLKK